MESDIGVVENVSAGKEKLLKSPIAEEATNEISDGESTTGVETASAKSGPGEQKASDEISHGESALGEEKASDEIYHEESGPGQQKDNVEIFHRETGPGEQKAIKKNVRRKRTNEAAASFNGLYEPVGQGK